MPEFTVDNMKKLTAAPTAQITTGCLDKNGKQICLDDIVRTPGDFTGRIVFVNAAYRVDIEGFNGSLLDMNSSLLFCDRWKPSQFEVT